MTSFPLAFETRIRNQFGNDAEHLLTSLNQDPLVSVRLNAKKSITHLAGFEINQLKKIAWSEQSFYLPQRPNFTADPLIHAGAYYVQEASSMFLEQALKTILPADKPVVVLDLCAAPGGKSTLINSLISEESFLVANEVIRSRASILEENLTKWGYINKALTSSDAKDFGKMTNFFDIIVLDAPCSGEGMFRKDKSARDEWSEENVNHCSLRQQRIIDDVLPALKPNGYLIYSTCTFAPAENEELIRNLVLNKQFLSIQIPMEAKWGVEEKTEIAFTYHFYPHKVQGEGLFVACLQKKDAEIIKPLKHKAVFGKNTNRNTFLTKNLIAEIQSWLQPSNDFDYIIQNEKVLAFLEIHLPVLNALKDNTYILGFGLNMGKLIQNQIVPSHDLALSNHIQKNLPSIDVEESIALLFLKKADISMNIELDKLENTWILVKFKGRNLGWIKKIGNRCNNYYPKNWRILMDV
jgi:NOL1/NOP2/sun family putative RNA methylase